MYGKHHSDDTKKKMSISGKLSRGTDEYRNKMSVLTKLSWQRKKNNNLNILSNEKDNSTT